MLNNQYPDHSRRKVIKTVTLQIKHQQQLKTKMIIAHRDVNVVLEHFTIHTPGPIIGAANLEHCVHIGALHNFTLQGLLW